MASDQEVKLRETIAAADHLYATKKYEDAAEKYSDAAALQDEVHGEMNPLNADLLYAYGRCLYQVAIQKSDVLGGKVAGEKESKGEKPSKKRKRESGNAPTASVSNAKDDVVAEKVVEKVVESKDGIKSKDGPNMGATSDKPFFQITGDDADWDSSEDEGDEDNDADDAPEAGDAEDEEEDDLATAYEVLDLARVLLTKKVESLRAEGKGKEAESPDLRKSLEKLADTRDQQAEICLENERFADAIEDARASLEMKKELYPQESSLIAEAHFKLSLALEFASTSYLKTDGAPEEATSGQTVDEEKRKDAASHMQAAIDSSKLRMRKQEEALSTMDEAGKQKAKLQIADVKDIIADMQTRLQDLHSPAADYKSMLGSAGASDSSNPLGGILGSILGESEADKNARLKEATQNANDLTSMVKKKKPRTNDASASTVINSNGKRAADTVQDRAGVDTDKKAKTEDKT